MYVAPSAHEIDRSDHLAAGSCVGGGRHENGKRSSHQCGREQRSDTGQGSSPLDLGSMGRTRPWAGEVAPSTGKSDRSDFSGGRPAPAVKVESGASYSLLAWPTKPS